MNILNFAFLNIFILLNIFNILKRVNILNAILLCFNSSFAQVADHPVMFCLSLQQLQNHKSTSLIPSYPSIKNLTTFLFRTHVIVSPGSPGKGEGEEGDEGDGGEDEEDGKYEGRPGVARPLNKGKR